MKEHVILFFTYLLLPALFGLLLNQENIGLILKVVICAALILVFWKKIKFKFRIDILSVSIGVVIFLIWIFLEGHYPALGSSSYDPQSTLMIIVRLLSAIAIAPIVEELFTRDFMIRFLQGENWRKIPAGTFTWASFLITVFFFGFSHDRWLPGIIAGVLFNIIYYIKKDVGYCVTAHAVANLCLSAYVLNYGAWQYW